MEREIIEIEDAVKEAQLNGDIDFFENLLADGFKFISPQGKIISKREDIDQYKSGQLKISKIDISNRQIDMFGSTAISRFKVQFEGTSGKYQFSTKFIFTRVYSKVGNAWKMVAGHSTEVCE